MVMWSLKGRGASRQGRRVWGASGAIDPLLCLPACAQGPTHKQTNKQINQRRLSKVSIKSYKNIRQLSFFWPRRILPFGNNSVWTMWGFKVWGLKENVGDGESPGKLAGSINWRERWEAWVVFPSVAASCPPERAAASLGLLLPLWAGSREEKEEEKGRRSRRKRMLWPPWGREAARPARQPRAGYCCRPSSESDQKLEVIGHSTLEKVLTMT